MRFVMALSCVVAFAGFLHRADAGEINDFPLDPVAYIGGQEQAGKDEFTIERGAYRYKFIDGTNKQTFEKDPERYEVQLGGACARMGPLMSPMSGELHAVHDGKIYVFASENCRSTFVSNPDGLLEGDDPPPDVSDESIRRGRELIDKMVTAMGGAERIDAIKTYDDKMYMVANNDSAHNALYIVFPDSFCEMHKRNETYWSHTATRDNGWLDSNERADAMVNAQRRAFMRQMSRLLIVIAKSRNEPTFICSYIGPGEIADQKGEQVAVALNGATSILLLDSETGKVLAQSYRGRGPNAFLGEVSHIYSDHTTYDGVTLPITWRTNFNGDYNIGQSGTLDEVHINGTIDEKLFEMPKGK